jgi:methylenetetrahydrofolate reductase (NADPH)
MGDDRSVLHGERVAAATLGSLFRMARIPDLLVSRRTLSFEFFPPKTPSANMTLGRTVAAIESLHPDFVSITYGAGGSDRHRTGEVVEWMLGETTWSPMPHLTCRGHRRADVGSLLDRYAELGIENILALGGDPPAGAVEEPGDYLYAMDLLEDVVAAGGFAVGVAAHPQVHPRSPDRATDRRHLAAKLSVADFALTQFFFEVEHWVRLVEELSDLGVDKPVLPGIMPINSKAMVKRMAEMSGAALPSWLADRLDATDDPDEVRRIGIDVATQLCSDLIDAGTPGLHLYALNRPESVVEICVNLGLTTV